MQNAVICLAFLCIAVISLVAAPRVKAELIGIKTLLFLIGLAGIGLGMWAGMRATIVAVPKGWVAITFNTNPLSGDMVTRTLPSGTQFCFPPADSIHHIPLGPFTMTDSALVRTIDARLFRVTYAVTWRVNPARGLEMFDALFSDTVTFEQMFLRPMSRSGMEGAAMFVKPNDFARPVTRPTINTAVKAFIDGGGRTLTDAYLTDTVTVTAVQFIPERVTRTPKKA